MLFFIFESHQDQSTRLSIETPHSVRHSQPFRSWLNEREQIQPNVKGLARRQIAGIVIQALKRGGAKDVIDDPLRVLYAALLKLDSSKTPQVDALIAFLPEVHEDEKRQRQQRQRRRATRT